MITDGKEKYVRVGVRGGGFFRKLFRYWGLGLKYVGVSILYRWEKVKGFMYKKIRGKDDSEKEDLTSPEATSRRRRIVN